MKKSVFVFVLLAAWMTPLHAQNEEIQFSIRFYNKEIYTTDPNQPILIQVGLRNQGESPLWFSLPNQAVFQLAFQVMSAGRTGLYLPNSEKFNEKRFGNQPVFFRDVVIQRDEEFNYVVNLKDFVDFSEPGIYTVACDFFPKLLPEFQSARNAMRISQSVGEMEAMSDEALRSNVLTLSLRPAFPIGTNKKYEESLDHETQDFLRRENKSPDDVVKYLLEARQDQKEARFFLYLNLEDLYKRAPQFRRSFLAASQEERIKILEDFRNELWRREETLSKVPSAFEILSTHYTSQEATVTARLKFDGGDYLEIREYKYALKKNAGYWEIYDYQVRNLGTERKGLR